MTKIFNKEVETWSGLYSARSAQRYAIFQGNAKRRMEQRMELAVQMLEPHPGMEVLDLACGSGALAPRLLQHDAHWTGVDIAFNMLAAGFAAFPEDSKQVNWINASAEQLPFADAWFDAIVCLGMINFYPPAKVPGLLLEMKRILKPGGVLVLSSLRLDALTWVRSRLYPRIPLPFSSPGPLYPHHYRRVEQFGKQAGLHCIDRKNVRKYLGLPHYSLIKFIKDNGG